MATPGKRPFWMHQIAEYIIAAAFIAQGLQSPSPAVPSVLGGLVLLNAACAKAPAAAFRLVDRRMHRLLDLLVIGLIVVMAVQPVVSIENNTRVIMGVLAFVLAFVWLGSDFSAHVPREQSLTAAAKERVADGVRLVATKAPVVSAKASTAASSVASRAAGVSKAVAASRSAAPSESAAPGPTPTPRPTPTTRPPTTGPTPTGAAPKTPSSTADTVGRAAGRLAGKGLNAYREQSAKRRKK